ncbi:MAG: hypothetical protein LBN03_02425 [Bifidobacteriaceae bacterium]|jgi:DNA polymerase-3 subunit epsilon|nr:hypothetical protein [Bifidobacteriaceae bacterium]
MQFPNIKIDTNKLVGFDTETTGVSVVDDRIIQAVLIYNGTDGNQIVKEYFINPGVPIPEEASAIHGFSNEFIAEHGKAPKETLDEIANIIVSSQKQGYYLVIQNASFDLPILNNELKRYGLPTLGDRLEQPTVPYLIDPLVIDRKEDKYRKGKRQLINIAEYYKIEIEGDLHNAVTDVKTMLKVCVAILSKFPKVAKLAGTDLHKYQTDAFKDWADNFNSYLKKQGKPADVPTVWVSDLS